MESNLTESAAAVRAAGRPSTGHQGTPPAGSAAVTAASPAFAMCARLDGEAIVTKTVIGLLHPGEMGAAVGRCLTGRGHTMLWASEGRGPASAHRAEAAGLID